MMARAALVWMGIACLAVLNGAFREGVLLPLMGETAARAISTVMLSVLILIVAALSIDWIRPAAPDVWRIGVFWLALTLAFEFLAGHYLFGLPWPRIAADYYVFQGRIWILVLIITLLAPTVAAAFRGRSL